MKEVVTMPQRSDGQQEANEYRNLVSLPLPGPAVVIDMRSHIPQDRQLVWNLATEIEDLTTKIRLSRVNRWRYLQQLIEFITLESLPTGETASTAARFTLTDATNRIEAFPDTESLIEHIHRKYVDRVRTNRNNALTDTDRLIQEPEQNILEREQPTVRVFFIIDIEEPDAFNNAAAFANMLRQKTYQYDDPQHTGRNELISPVAICINTDKTDRESISRWPQSRLPEEWRSPVFDMMILIHAYDDARSFMNRQVQHYELELILYAMLLSSENLTTDKQDMRDEDANHYLSTIAPEEEKDNTEAALEADWREMLTVPSSVSPVLCMVGAASFEYSVRWGTRWLDYGLVKEILGTLCEQPAGLSQNDLCLPDGRNWLDDWWTDVKKVVATGLINTMGEFKGVVGLERCIKTSPYQGVSLRNSGKALAQYCEKIASYYSEGQSVPTLQQALANANQLVPVIHDAMKNHLEKNISFSAEKEEEIEALLDLQVRANRFPIALFKGAPGAISNSINQITELEEQVARGEIGQLAHATPKMKQRRGAFGDEVKKAEHRQRELIKTWNIPLVGEVQRTTVLSVLLALLAILFAWTVQSHLSGLPGTASLFPGFPGLSPFILLCCVIAAGAVLFSLARHNQKLYRQRESIVAPLQSLVSTHLHEVCNSIAAKTALILLQNAELYHPEGKSGQYKKRLRTLHHALVEAQQHALDEQKGAYERLKPGWTQATDTTRSRDWLHLNSRKDLLLWNEVLEVFQQLKAKYTSNNPSLDSLAKLLLNCLEPERYSIFSAQQSKSQPFLGQKSRSEQLQQLGTEVVAILLSEEIVGPRITTLHPLLEKYLSLDNPGLQASSALGRHIADLYDMIKVIMLEKAMSNPLDSSSHPSFPDDFEVKSQKTVEQIMAAWVEYLRSDDEEITAVLNQDSIMSRLSKLKLLPSNVLEDLNKRCRLLGLPREALESDHSYFLLAPEPVSDTLLDSLATFLPVHLHLVPFPDQEKLIYLHMYQIRLRANDNFFLT